MEVDIEFGNADPDHIVTPPKLICSRLAVPLQVTEILVKVTGAPGMVGIVGFPVALWINKL